MQLRCNEYNKEVGCDQTFEGDDNYVASQMAGHMRGTHGDTRAEDQIVSEILDKRGSEKRKMDEESRKPSGAETTSTYPDAPAKKNQERNR